jgi:D-apionolactonase
MSMTPDRLRLLHGTEAPLAELRSLRAGPVSLLLDGIDLRYLRLGEAELVRRVYTAVRDVDWDTVPPEISNYEVEESDFGFRVEFDARHQRGEIDFEWHGTISGVESGRVEYLFDGRALSVCPYNRIGLCVHHPWRETKGARFRARTPEGEIEGVFPDVIGQQRIEDGAYHALFAAFDRLEVGLASGGELLLEFEGDLWETEDHRNWTDANFKTYSTPIGLGRPTPLEVGQVLRQRLVITPPDARTAAAATEGPVRLTLGGPTGTRVPRIGLGQDRDHHVPDARERDVLSTLAPKHLRVEVHLDRGDWRDALTTGVETARAVRAHVELSVHLLEEHSDELAALAEALTGAPPIDRVLVVNADSRTATLAETTRPALVDAAREALRHVAAGAAFVGGTEIYFTEINRTHPELASWDGVCYSISPQIHAFTDIDVMENLDAQAETVRSARALARAKEIVVSPVTLRRRVNFHAAGDPPPTQAGDLPDSVDVRQSALFGGAWTAGSVKYLSEAGASSVTYYETTGWRGIMERAGGSELPERFRSAAGEVFPVFHPLADAIEWHGAEILGCGSSDVLSVVGLAVRDGAATRLLVANLTPAEQAVAVAPVEGDVALRRLNEETAAEAASDPRAFRRRVQTATADGELALVLAPYEVVRVDPA